MSRYEVYWHDEAARELDELQERQQLSVARVAARRVEDPWAGDVEVLRGGDGLLRARAGAFRVIYYVDDPERRVVIVAVTPRRESYPRRLINRWLRRRDRFAEGC